MQKPFSVKNLCLAVAAASVPVPASVLSPFVLSNPSLHLHKFLGSEEALTSGQANLLRSDMSIVATQSWFLHLGLSGGFLLPSGLQGLHTCPSLVSPSKFLRGISTPFRLPMASYLLPSTWPFSNLASMVTAGPLLQPRLVRAVAMWAPLPLTINLESDHGHPVLGFSV